MNKLDKLKRQFKKNTEGLVTEGVASLKVSRGTYELHLKPVHLSEKDMFNIFTVKELSNVVYEDFSERRVEHMLQLDEFPLNFRSYYKTKDDIYVLSETHMFMDELLTDGDLDYFIDYDMKLVQSIEDGSAIINGKR